MKNPILNLVLGAALITSYSFTYIKEKEDRINGTFQVFVNSFKEIEATPIASENAFKDRKNDKLFEGFQMYTFDFDNNYVDQHYLLSDANGVIDSYDVRSKITHIETDGNFAYLTIEDKSNYYSTVKEKYFVLNLNSDPKYPMLSAFWKNQNQLKGTYSIDHNTLSGLIGSPDPGMIFNDN
jgi:hypothetical protein